MTRCAPRPGERVEIERQRGDEGLTLTGLHLRDPPEVERGAAHDLHVEVPLTEGAQATFADDRERLGEEVVEQVGARVVVLGLVEALAERRTYGGAGRRRSKAWISGSRPLTTGAIDSSTLSFLPSPACSSLLNRPIRPSMLPAARIGSRSRPPYYPPDVHDA